MKVLLIWEDYHGVLGVAKNVDSAISFLIKEKWLREDTGIWHEHKDEWVLEPIKDVYGNDWEQFLRSLTVEQFNEIWESCFSLQEEEVFGTP